MNKDKAIKIATDFLRAVDLQVNGKPVEKPTKGPNIITMKKGVTFAGDKDKTIKILEDAYPDCKFDWKK